MKRILVLAAGLYYGNVFKQLAANGFHVLAVDRDPHAPGAAFAHEFSPIDITDRERVLQWAREKQIDGIMAVNDFGTRTAAYVAREMALVGLDLDTVEAANDKGLMRDRWRAAGLPIPEYRVIANLQSLREAVEAIGLPCVLKPTDCGGSGRGISVIRDRGDLEWAFEFAEPYAGNGRLIVEQFIDGTEMTVETLSVAGEVTVLAMSDKVKPELRTRVATSLNYPAAMPIAVLREVEDTVRRAVLSIGIDNGMAHTEIIVAPDGRPVLVEIGARGGGGHIFHTLIEAVSGINAPVEFARLLCGLEVNLPPVLRRGGVYRFFNPPRGILQAVRNVEEARALPGVLDIAVVKKPGDLVGDLSNSLQRAGFVVTSGPDREAAMAIADEVEKLVEFEVSPQEAVPAI